MSFNVTSEGQFLQVNAQCLGGDGNSYQVRFHLSTDGGQPLEDAHIVRDEYGDVVGLSFTVTGQFEVGDLFDGMATLAKLR